MKTRCERPQYGDKTQLQQCRRCIQAQTNCITTVESQLLPGMMPDERTQRYKRPRTPSFESIDTDHRNEYTGAFGEQQQDFFLDGFLARSIAESTPYTQSSGTNSDQNILPPSRTDLQWLEFGHDFGLEENPIPDNLAFLSKVVSHESKEGLTNGDNPETAVPMVNTNETVSATENDCGIPQCNRLVDLRSESELSNQSVTRVLLEFNHKISSSLQYDNNTSRIHDCMATTLGHSKKFVELLNRIVPHEQAIDITVTPKDATGELPIRSKQIDIEIALQILSCHTSMHIMYEKLYKSLVDHDFQLKEATILPALQLEGLQALSSDMRSHMLVQICMLTLAEIQAKMNSIRRSGSLTPIAARTFESVLGTDASEPWRPRVGVKCVADEFRDLLRKK
ncbi:hypothetical protein EJ05DRAFT_473268 [Pseudovirgaria hyperparasitica]|uniref:Uncharacterized protein n=1 Tax=Pseudovirgaria hyperparasitica TaxID=470096 RepID=A0A6A6WJI9_9PEZI|nr:uncharacterized protein EJ05DRAFT_473268 [Pseudovirgaria hyperparasitica]KAF2762360.1 hypothetical protein EJ05DRAFT_473268 [Pseudovirgaria hyperparasitica]